MNRALILLPLLLTGCTIPPPLEGPTYDLPALMGKDIDGVKAVLDAPISVKERPGPYVRVESKWIKNGKVLVVTSRKDTGKIVDFLIGCDAWRGVCADVAPLLEIGNLKEGETRYSIEFLGTFGRPNEYTGVKAVPAAN